MNTKQSCLFVFLISAGFDVFFGISLYFYIDHRSGFRETFCKYIEHSIDNRCVNVTVDISETRTPNLKSLYTSREAAERVGFRCGFYPVEDTQTLMEDLTRTRWFPCYSRHTPRELTGGKRINTVFQFAHLKWYQEEDRLSELLGVFISSIILFGTCLMIRLMYVIELCKKKPQDSRRSSINKTDLPLSDVMIVPTWAPATLPQAAAEEGKQVGVARQDTDYYWQMKTRKF